jgi:hypothetical protein
MRRVSRPRRGGANAMAAAGARRRLLLLLPEPSRARVATAVTAPVVGSATTVTRSHGKAKRRRGRTCQIGCAPARTSSVEGRSCDAGLVWPCGSEDHTEPWFGKDGREEHALEG